MLRASTAIRTRALLPPIRPLGARAAAAGGEVGDPDKCPCDFHRSAGERVLATLQRAAQKGRPLAAAAAARDGDSVEDASDDGGRAAAAEAREAESVAAAFGALGGMVRALAALDATAQGARAFIQATK